MAGAFAPAAAPFISAGSSGRIAQLGPKGQSTPLPTSVHAGMGIGGCGPSGPPHTGSYWRGQHTHELGASGVASAGNGTSTGKGSTKARMMPDTDGGAPGGTARLSMQLQAGAQTVCANPYVAAAAAAAQRLRDQSSSNSQLTGGSGGAQQPNQQHAYWQAKRSELEARLDQGLHGAANCASARPSGGALPPHVNDSHIGQVRISRREEKAAVSSTSAQQAQLLRQQHLDQEQRLREEKLRKKILWEEELQRELVYQQEQQARRSLGPGGASGSTSGSFYPE